MRRFLIIEGGSSNNVTQHREGFVKFLRKANVRNPPRIVFAGPRSKAIRSYRDHHSRGDEAKVLVDAEAAVSESTSLEHLVRRGEIAAITKVVEARDRVNGNVEKISKRDAEPRPAVRVRPSPPLFCSLAIRTAVIQWTDRRGGKG